MHGIKLSLLLIALTLVVITLTQGVVLYHLNWMRKATAYNGYMLMELTKEKGDVSL